MPVPAPRPRPAARPPTPAVFVAFLFALGASPSRTAADALPGHASGAAPPRTAADAPPEHTLGASPPHAAADASPEQTPADPPPRTAADALPQHTLGVGLGYGRTSTLDEAASDLAYGAHLGLVGLEYAGEARAARWSVRTHAGYGAEEALAFDGRTIRFQTLEPDGTTTEVVVPMRGTRLIGGAEASATYLLRRARFDVLVGGAVDFVVARPDGFVTPGLMQRLGLGPLVGVRYRLDARQRLELEARTSLVGWATRLPYHQTVSIPNHTAYEGFVRQGSAARTPASQQTLDVTATYRCALREHLALRAIAALGYLRDDDPRPLRALALRALLYLDVPL